jgi:hypothetical protein
LSSGPFSLSFLFFWKNNIEVVEEDHRHIDKTLKIKKPGKVLPQGILFALALALALALTSALDIALQLGLGRGKGGEARRQACSRLFKFFCWIRDWEGWG